jgi:hypothetical protein
MDIPRRLKINKEQDFLLIAGEARGEVVQSTQRMYELPRRSNDAMVEITGSPTEPRGNPPANTVAHRMIWSAAWIISTLAVDFYLQCRGYSYHAVIAFRLFPLLGVIGGIFSLIAKTVNENRRSRMFEVSHLWMSPAQRYPGDWVICRLQFKTKRNVYLDNIAAKLIAEEVAVSDDGSTSDTYRRDAYKQSFAKSYTENLSAGRLIEFSCDLPVLPGAPVTFSSTHNSIDWFVIIKMTFKGLPAWEKTVPITVLPFNVSSG